MGFLTNIWTRYSDRTADAVADNVLTNMQANVPEITDHSLMNLFVKIVKIFGGISELLHYYIDNAAREAQMDGARIYSNVVKLSRAYDYRISSHQGAYAQLTFEYTSTSTLVWPGTSIPAGAIVSTADGLQFVTIDDLTIPAGSYATARGQVSAQNIQAITGQALGTSDGTADQVFVVDEKVAGFSIVVKIGIQVWTSVETLAYSKPTDLHFVQSINEDGKVTVKFGDGLYGLIPPAASAITIDYYTTAGATGNVDGQTITQIISGVPVVASYSASVTNRESAVGGRDIEPIISIKQGTARSIRTRLRAVTPLDFVDIALIHPQVENAAIIFTCGKVVDLYIVPVGGGLAPPALLTDVENFFEDKRIVTVGVSASTAGQIRITAKIVVYARPGYQVSAVKPNVEAAWVNYFLPANQTISGTVNIGDLYEAVEAAEGVKVSEITLLNAQPYARPTATTLVPLDWDVEVLPGSTVETHWQILITSPTQYQLLKDNNFVGTFTIGALVTQTEVEFTVNASTYTVGDRWDFITYPYGGNKIELNEPSIPVSSVADIQLTVIPTV